MIATDDVVHLAEQATLGGLLLAPTHFHEINGWLRGQDFTDPWHRMAWVALREADIAGRTVDAEGLAGDLLDRHGPRVADIVRVHDLLAAVPRDPDPRPHARVVVEFGVRREIAAQGVLLEGAAALAAMHLEARPLHAALRIVGAGLLVAGERWAEASGEGSAHLADQLPTQLKAGAASLELRRTADKLVAQAPELGGADLQVNEARLVACLVSHPTAISPTIAWLRPDRLVNKPWRTVYVALGDLADRGQSIDPVSLATAVLRTGRLTGAAPTAGELAEAVVHERISVPGHLRRLVATDHVRQLAHSGAHALRAGAANPGTQIVDLLDTATVLIQSLRQIVSVMPDVAGSGSVAHMPVLRDGAPWRRPDQERGGPVAG